MTGMPNDSSYDYHLIDPSVQRSTDQSDENIKITVMLNLVYFFAIILVVICCGFCIPRIICTSQLCFQDPYQKTKLERQNSYNRAVLKSGPLIIEY